MQFRNFKWGEFFDAIARMALCGIVFCIIACTSAPKPQVQETAAQRLKRQSMTIGQELNQKIEKQVHIKRDDKSEAFLVELGLKLIENTHELRGNTLEVRMTHESGEADRDFALPGIKLYFSKKFLRRVEFENELAAAMAIEFAHLIHEDVVHRIEKLSPAEKLNLKKSDLFGSKGLFAFDDGENAEALATAVKILYVTGYDPRGALALIEHFDEEFPKGPYSKECQACMERTRQAIASYAPLRNPIVRTEAFLAFKRRIRRL